MIKGPIQSEPSSGSRALDKHLQTIPKDALYHYCDTKAVIGIAEKKELWATDLGFLNDEAERDHGIDLICKKIRSLRSNVGPHQHDEKDFWVELEKQTQYRGGTPSVYVASFTEEVTLPMFRMYCPPDGGYCLRFPTSQIKAMAECQEFRLVKCIYRDDEKDTIITELLLASQRQYSLQQALLKSGELKPGPGPAYKQDAMTFGELVSSWAPLMKHHSFESEKEWRIVSKGFNGNQPKDRMGFRESRFGITPYYKFKLALPNQYPDLVRQQELDSSFFVWVGPANTDQNRRKSAVKQLFWHHLGCSVGAGVFSSTFR